FCTVELSSFYVDVLKDRLYCNSQSDLRRRAAQTVMSFILEGLAKYLAPLMPFTSEETWKSLGHLSSVHLEKFERTSSDPYVTALQALREWGTLPIVQVL